MDWLDVFLWVVIVAALVQPWAIRWWQGRRLERRIKAQEDALMAESPGAMWTDTTSATFHRLEEY